MDGKSTQLPWDALQQEKGGIAPLDAINAAQTVALMKCADCEPLLQRLKKKSVGAFGHGDYVEALGLLRGRLDIPPLSLWQEPVEEWLGPRWQMARDWYAREAEDDSEDDIDTGIRRARELTERFVESSEAADSAGLPDSEGLSPPTPIVEHSPKIGRNQPCPCGSGKKYKKCCGSTNNSSGVCGN